MSKYFATTHPENEADITVEVDENNKFINAIYADDDQDVDITPELKEYFQKECVEYYEK